MIIGIDVGGTHTDAVLLSEQKIVKSVKIETDHDNLLGSTLHILDLLTEDVLCNDIKRISLSTTLSTNAIVEGKNEEVGILVTGGPGIDPELYKQGNYFAVVSGVVDHRGNILQEVDEDQVADAIRKFDTSVRVFACVSKFSTRNAHHEKSCSRIIGDCADFITCGHELSGHLSFPRRINTAYLNSSVWRIYNSFIQAVEEAVEEKGISAPLLVLKADGGTLQLKESRKQPVQTILSGPAASVMGGMACCNIDCHTVLVDMGGTTSDISLFINGTPIIEPDGISIGDLKTHVRSLMTHSIGLGGDSEITISNGEVNLESRRSGPPIARGGEHPALTDALNYLNYSSFGDVEKSRQGIESLCSDTQRDPEGLCNDVITQAVEKIVHTINALCEEVSVRPVYTIHEMLDVESFAPEKVIVIGGPAEVFAPLLEERMKMPVEVPEYAGVANAIGAALARETVEIEIHADTQRCIKTIPALSIESVIDPDYNLESAEFEAREYVREALVEHGNLEKEIAVDITESSEFTMVDGYYTVGKDIRVRAQRRPGVMHGI